MRGVAKNDRFWCLARALRVLVLVVWWLGCGIDSGDGSAPPPPGQRPPPALTSAECDRLGGDWVPTAQVAAGGFCRLGGGVLGALPLPDAGAPDR